MKIHKVLGFICYVACNAVAAAKFGFCGILLVLACWTGAMIYFTCEPKEDEGLDKLCDGCEHNKDGNCVLHLEDECAKGWGYQLWKTRDDIEYEHDSCEGCRHHLGGGCCDLNLEDECAAGGGYELWREEDE